VKHVLARVVETRDCPLYPPGAALVFAGPGVRCEGAGTVCALAVERLVGPVRKVERGKDPARAGRVACPGCGADFRAWFDLRAYPVFEAAPAVPVDRGIVAQLRRSLIFAPYPEEDIALCVAFFEPREHQPGDVIVEQGRPSPGIFVLVEGEVDVLRTGADGTAAHIATLAAGDCFGEMSVITGQGASAQVRARTPARSLMAPREAMARIYTVLPTLPSVLARLLASRLADMSAQFARAEGAAMRGRLDRMPPADLLQSLAIARATGQLVLDSAGRCALVTFQDGRLMHAELEGQTGEEVIYEVLRWTEGTYEFQPGEIPPARTVDRDATGVLLEGLRRMDESIRDTQVRIVRKPVGPAVRDAGPA
jgi:CRP-like cAMP-binding protein